MPYVSIGAIRCSLCGCDDADGEVLVGKGAAIACGHCIEALSKALGENRGEEPPKGEAFAPHHGRPDKLRAFLEKHFKPFALEDLATIRRVFPLRSRADVQ